MQLLLGGLAASTAVLAFIFARLYNARAKAEESTKQTLTDVLALVNTSEILVFAAELDTQKIIYVTDTWKKTYNITDDVIGKPCHEVFRGKTSQCEFCPCHKLNKEPGAVIVWEEHNPTTNRYYRHTDKYIEWTDGRLVHVQSAVDLTEIKLALNEIDKRDILLQTVNYISDILLNVENATSADSILESMEAIGACIDVDSVEVWRIGTKTVTAEHIWLSEFGIQHTAQVYGLTEAYFLDWKSQLSDRANIIRGPISAYSLSEQALYNKFKVKSLWVLPLFMKEELWGFFCLKDFTSSRDFSDGEISILHSAGYMFANSIINQTLAINAADANNRARLMLDTSPLCCFIWNSKLRIMDCNEMSVQLFGVTNKKELFEKFYDFSPKFQPSGQLTRDAIAAKLEQAFSEGYLHFMWNHCLPNGDDLPVEITAVRVKHGKEYVLVSYTRDLREHLKMMDIIQKQTSEFALQTSTFKALLDTVPDLIYQKGLSSSYVWCNKKMADFLGMEQDDIIGKTDEQAFSAVKSPNDFRGQDSHVIETGLICKFENTIIKPDGKTYIFDTFKAPLVQDGKIIGIVGVSREVTDRKKMEQSLIEASKAKGEFLSSMSHEMRTPMNVIIGMTTIGRRAATIEEKDDALHKVSDASSHLLGLINDVLDMAKIEARKLQLSPCEYNFQNMLNKVLESVGFLTEEKNQELIIEIDPAIPPYVIGDNQRLSQVYMNLLTNATKFTPNGGNIHLKISLTDEADNVCELRTEVTDSGIGISSENREKLFHAFEQAEGGTSREFGGTGLGLTISKSIVELMDGEIWIDPEYNNGARFIFTAKMGRSDKVADNEGEPVPFEYLEGEFLGKRMLLVEDLEINRQILITLLRDTGLIIDSAENGEEAVKAIKDDSYDIVFMDIQMPKMDGYEATLLIRGLNCPVPIVAMTANVFTSDIEKCFSVGMNDYVRKPLDIKNVIETLRKFLGKSENAKARAISPDRINENAESLYRSFVRDASRVITELENFNNDGTDIRTFTVSIHGIKTALANINEKELSHAALQLELAGRINDTDYIFAELPLFIERLRTLTQKLNEHKKRHADTKTGEKSVLREKLLELEEKCMRYDSNGADDILTELQAAAWEQPIAELLEKIEELLLFSEFDEVVEAIGQCLGN